MIGCLAAAGQKLAFQNLSTDKGLIQAQVFCITQDQQHHLWIGTAGGIDRFDGSAFRHFTKTDGLSSTLVFDLHAAPNGYIWASTDKGISCHNGYTITNYPYAIGKSALLSSDKSGNIWALNGGNALSKFVGNKLVVMPNAIPDAKPICMAKDREGGLLVNFHPYGFYKLADGNWRPFAEIPIDDTTIKYKKLIYANQAWYALADSYIAMYMGGTKIASATISDGAAKILCADKRGNIWVGMPKGVRVFNGKDLSAIAQYEAASGFSDNTVNDLFCDVEGNLWLATDGDGLFKFSEGVFGRYDNSNGLPGKIVMGLVRNQNDNLYIATREGGLVEFDCDSKKMTPIDVSPLKGQAINCITQNKAGELLLGKVNGGAMLYSGGRWQTIKLNEEANKGVNGIYCDGDKTWFATNKGCYYRQRGMVNKVDSINGHTFCVLPLPNNETLIGTIDGLYKFTGTGPASKVLTPQLQNTGVLCMITSGPFIIIGTLDDGLFFWNRQTGLIHQCNLEDGLSDNRVFSLLVDSKKNTWVVTGTSVQQVKLLDDKGAFSIRHFSAPDGYPNSEGNLNAIVEDKLGRIWIGNTNGAAVFNGDLPEKETHGPFTVIQQVDVPNDLVKGNELLPWYQLPKDLVLPYSKNSISFIVKGIYLKDPESIKYSYQLVGYDREFSIPENQTFFNFQNLNPGRYEFRVKAVTASGIESKNIAVFAFTVATPFYKATWFYVLLGLLLLVTGGSVQFLLMQASMRKRKQRALIRKEEQQAIRLRTSEDFHDELGNKLTRISLLADILQKKTGPGDEEKNKLIAQIKENVLALYAGTRDIIWSLSAGSDSLKETLNRIGQFGEELFLGTDIQFEMRWVHHIDAAIILPMDYSRNILMIFKEALNNSLKHAQCTQVTIIVQKMGDGSILITQNDNGKGFEGNLLQKGNGLNNIRRRAQRIHAEVDIIASPNKGTSIVLMLKIPPKG